MKKKFVISLPTAIIICALLLVSFLSIKEFAINNSRLDTEKIFEKDEYCRRTYADSFVKNYEKSLIGKNEDESEYISLVDIFYSPTESSCYAVYDYYYVYLKDPIIGPNGEEIGIIEMSNFEKRISSALNAEIIDSRYENSFLRGDIKDHEERQRYNERLEELKSYSKSDLK